MAVAQIGTPTATSAVTTTNTTVSATNTWSASQPRTTGDLLVMVVTASAATSVTLPTVPSGWSQAVATGNTGTGPHAAAAVFYAVASGGDAAPTSPVTVSGSSSRVDATLFEFSGINTTSGSPIDASGTFASGSSSATLTGITVTTTSAVSASGEYALAVFAIEASAASTITWTPGGSWSSFFNDGATSLRGHNAIDTLTPPAAGATASDAATFTSTASAFGAAAIVVLAAARPFAGRTQPARASIPQVFSRGRVGRNAGAPVHNPAAPVPAPFYPPSRPARAPAPRPPRGRVTGSSGNRVSNPVPAIPLHGPVRSPIPQRPATGGRVRSSTGNPVSNPVPAPPWHGPVRAPIPARPRSGSARSSAGSPATSPPPGPPRLSGPVRARIPAPGPRGHTASTPATPVRSSPVMQTQFSPLNKAARAQPAMFRKGRITSAPGVPPVNPVPANIWHAPVRARIPQRPAGGRTHANAGAPVHNPVTRLVTLTAGDLHLRWETASGSGRWQATPGNGRWDTANGPGRWLEREHAPDWTEAST